MIEPNDAGEIKVWFGIIAIGMEACKRMDVDIPVVSAGAEHFSCAK
jgi:hypothetical protein